MNSNSTAAAAEYAAGASEYVNYTPEKGSITARAIKEIEKRGTMRTSEIADVIGCAKSSVASSLSRAVKHGVLVSCLIRTGRVVENEYRIGSGIPDKFTPLKTRPEPPRRAPQVKDFEVLELEHEVVDIPAPAQDGAGWLRQQAENASGALLARAGPKPAAQPEVAASNTGSALTDDATPSPPSGERAARGTPPPCNRRAARGGVSAQGFSDSRPSFTYYDNGDMVISSSGLIIKLGRDDVLRLSDFVGVVEDHIRLSLPR